MLQLNVENIGSIKVVTGIYCHFISDMVVSGVPETNGDLHAREIAHMSLDLVAECEEFIIPHRPEEKLKIRVGLHSGKQYSNVTDFQFCLCILMSHIVCK